MNPMDDGHSSTPIRTTGNEKPMVLLGHPLHGTIANDDSARRVGLTLCNVFRHFKKNHAQILHDVLGDLTGRSVALASKGVTVIMCHHFYRHYNKGSGIVPCEKQCKSLTWLKIHVRAWHG